MINYIHAKKRRAKYDGNDDEHPNMSGLLIALHKLNFFKNETQKTAPNGLFFVLFGLLFFKNFTRAEANILGI